MASRLVPAVRFLFLPTRPAVPAPRFAMRLPSSRQRRPLRPEAPRQTGGAYRARLVLLRLAAATLVAVTLPSVPAVSPSPAAAAEARPLGSGPFASRPEVFGFLPSWKLGRSSTRIDYGTLTTIAYFGLATDSAGNLLTGTDGWNGWTSRALSTVIDTAHAHGVRVVVTVESFAWTTAQARAQARLLSSASARLRLARQIAAAVKSRRIDGVNLDFEPIAKGQAANYVAFVRTLRQQLASVSRGQQLTVDSIAYAAGFPIAAVTASGAADAIVIMGYDYRTAGSASSGSIDSLPALRRTVADFSKATAPSKLILAIPFYGRAWSTASSAPGSRTNGVGGASSSVAVEYWQAAPLLAQHGSRFDAVAMSAWTAYRKQVCSSSGRCATTWRELYIDDAIAVAAKADLVRSARLRGIGIWALGFDGTYPELMRAVAAKFPARAPTAAVVAPPTAVFSSPARGTAVSYTNSLTVRWSESDRGGPGIASRTLWEQAAPAVGGTCNVSWRSSWRLHVGSPVGLVDFNRNWCYRYVLTLVDRSGRVGQVASGAILFR